MNCFSFIYIFFMVAHKVGRNAYRVRERYIQEKGHFVNMDSVSVYFMMIKFAAVGLIFLLALLCSFCLVRAMRRYHYYEYMQSRCANHCFLLATLSSVGVCVAYLFLSVEVLMRAEESEETFDYI